MLTRMLAPTVFGLAVFAAVVLPGAGLTWSRLAIATVACWAAGAAAVIALGVRTGQRP